MLNPTEAICIWYQSSVRQDSEAARQVRQSPDGLDRTLHIGRLNTSVVNIEEQQLLTNPSRAFGELQPALCIDQSSRGRGLQEVS
jgi:hypothetical protein